VPRLQPPTRIAAATVVAVDARALLLVGLLLSILALISSAGAELMRAT